MEEILVVEDSRFFGSLLKREIEKQGVFTVHLATTLAEALDVVADRGEALFLCLLDLHLPDAPNGEIVDYVHDRGIPAIVFSGTFDPALQNDLASMKILDYVLKDTPASLEYVVHLVHRIARNRNIKTMIVDDSATMRQHLGGMMRHQKFQVLEAGDGKEALEILEENPDIALILTDLEMPRMNGLDMIKAVRRNKSKYELAIIGLSGTSEDRLSARFIKIGANDFLKKPFQQEELFCRVNQNIELIETANALREAAYKDFLTGLCNRRRFFELGRGMFEDAKNGDGALTMVVMDIDHFKRVNDTYGHEAGDRVLISVARLIERRMSPHGVVARIGGEEFAMASSGGDTGLLVQHLDDLRREIEATTVHAGDADISVTVSMGVYDGLENTLDATLAIADSRLYSAKTNGRNRIIAAGDSLGSNSGPSRVTRQRQTTTNRAGS